jgi:hypothetical protein
MLWHLAVLPSTSASLDSDRPATLSKPTAKGLSQLQTLQPQNTNVSDAGAKDIQTALPQVQIIR